MIELPPFVMKVCACYGGFIVGSGAAYLLKERIDPPRDWDVIVPYNNWRSVCALIPKGSCTNSFGGIKLNCEKTGKEIDVWPDEMGRYFTEIPIDRPMVAYNPVTDITIRRSV